MGHINVHTTSESVYQLLINKQGLVDILFVFNLGLQILDVNFYRASCLGSAYDRLLCTSIIILYIKSLIYGEL